MRTFKEMRHYLMMNSEFVTQRDLYSLRQELYLDNNEIKEDVKSLKRDLDEVMNSFIPNIPLKQFVILNNMKFEASIAIEYIISLAKQSIIIIDDYPNIDTLSILRSKQDGVAVTLITDNKGKKLTLKHVNDFMKEYGNIAIKENGVAHDRFIILDYGTPYEQIYHLGQSIKDAGNKLGAINLISDTFILHPTIDLLLKGNNLKLI